MNAEREAVGRPASVRRDGAKRAFEERVVPRTVDWPWATTPWNWSEKRDQFEAHRLPKSKIP